MEPIAQIDIDRWFFTSSEELDSLQAGDSTVEVIGGIVRIDEVRRRANAAPQRVRLFRAVLSNGQGRQPRILFWEDRANEFEARVYRMVLHIIRARAVLANPQYARPEEQLMPIELSVSRNTEIRILGPLSVLERPAPVVSNITFENLAGARGMIRIDAYIRYEIIAEVYANGRYGSGDITDGTYHLNVHITIFDGASPPVGTPITIRGEVRRNNYNNFVLQVPDMNHIQVRDGVPVMTPQEVRGGWRRPPNDPAPGGHQQAANALNVRPAIQPQYAAVGGAVGLPALGALLRRDILAANNGAVVVNIAGDAGLNGPVGMLQRNPIQPPANLVAAGPAMEAQNVRVIDVGRDAGLNGPVHLPRGNPIQPPANVVAARPMEPQNIPAVDVGADAGLNGIGDQVQPDGGERPRASPSRDHVRGNVENLDPNLEVHANDNDGVEEDGEDQPDLKKRRQ